MDEPANTAKSNASGIANNNVRKNNARVVPNPPASCKVTLINVSILYITGSMPLHTDQ